MQLTTEKAYQMHDPKPYGLFVYQGELTENDLSFIDHCTKIVTNYKDVSQLESVKYTRQLPDGGFVIVQHSGGTFRAIAYKSQFDYKPTRTNVAQLNIPMLFSAAIDVGIVYRGEGMALNLTGMTTRRLSGYEQVAQPSSLSLQRFRCEYDNIYKKIFVPSAMQGLPTENVLFSQYNKLKATWYSGAMSEVVQIVSGFGRQDFDNLPDQYGERAQMRLPNEVMEAIKLELGEDVRLPAYTGFPDEKGQIKYSFMFDDTNLVSFDDERHPWLIKVDSLGVWAMPLPVIPATTTQAFYDYVAEMGDTELKKILDRFGAIPSGETFPTGADFFKWVRAGVIVKVCDSSDFYLHSPYTAVIGWSADSRGTNLINTCYDYKDGYCFGYTYQIKLNLKSTQGRGWAKRKNTQSLSPSDQYKVANYLSAMFAALPSDEDPLTQSIKYKIRCIPIETILERVDRDGASDVDYWDRYVCNPIANHQGRCSITNQGYLYGGTRIKIPDPFLEGCVNMSFAPDEPKTSYPKIDTIIYAYYIGDDLKVIKNFRDERTEIKEVEGNFEDIMVVGKWEQVEYKGLTGLNGEFYSSDFDHRQEIAPIEITTHIEGIDKGYGKPLAQYHAYFWTDGVLRRYRYYTQKTQRWETADRSASESFIIPYHMRNAAIYAQKDIIKKTKYSEQVVLLDVQDPYAYGFWTYEEVWHSFDNGMKKTAKPEPKDGTPVWAEEMYFEDHDPRSDFANEGDWIGGLPANVTHYVNPPVGLFTIYQYGGEEPSAETYKFEETQDGETLYELHASINSRPDKIHTNEQNDQYYGASPDEFGNVLYEDGCKVVFGDTNYANISVKKDGRRFRTGYCRLVSNQNAHTFIGVINE